MENLPTFLKDLSLAGSLALIFYLTVKTILANNRETINSLLKENKDQREEFVKIVTNHMAHEIEAQTKLANVIDRLDKHIEKLPEWLVEAIGRKKQTKPKT